MPAFRNGFVRKKVSALHFPAFLFGETQDLQAFPGKMTMKQYYNAGIKKSKTGQKKMFFYL